MPSTGRLRTTSTAAATAMVRPVKEDLNLNHPPEQFYSDSTIEQLRQTMLQQEVAFRNQVRELHRLYWNQKNLMNEALWKQSSSSLACNRPQEREFLTQEQQANEFECQLQMANSTHCRSISMQLPLNYFHEGARQEVNNKFLEVKDTASGQGAEFGVKFRKVHLGNGEANWSQSCAYTKSTIDLEVPAEMGPNETADRICPSGLRTLQLDGLAVCQSGDTVLSDFTSVSRMQKDSCPMPLKERDLPDDQTGKWSQRCFYYPDSEVQKSASIRSFNLPIEKCQATNNHLFIDLNIAQDEASLDASHDLVQTFSSPSTSSSGITNGDQQKNSNNKCYNKAEPNSVHRKQSETALPVTGHHSSENWLPDVVEESPPFTRQGSELSSTVTKNGCDFEKHVMDNEVYKSSTESPIELYENSMNTISNAYNGESHNCTYDGSISIRSLTQPETGKVGLPLTRQQTIVHNVDTNAGSSVNSKDGMEDKSLGASIESSNLLQSTGKDSLEQQCHNLGIEDDTISSRAVSTCEEQKSVLENFLLCSKLKLLAGSGRFTSEDKRVAESKITSSSNDFGSKIDAPNPEIVNSNEVPIVYTYDHIPNAGVSVPEEKVHQQTQSSEMDFMIVKAANALLSMSIKNSAYSHPSPDTDKLELEAGSESDQPQFSSDSFERLVLKLEELKDDGSSINSRSPKGETGNQFCTVNLRRGRRLRDFQKDILPGLVSLSRHEICEDIHTIKYELRKNRSCRASGQNFLVPVRSRRSRLQKYL